MTNIAIVRSSLQRLCLAIVMIGTLAPFARAQHDHAPPPLPTSFPAAIAAITDNLLTIERGLSGNKLDQAGDAAFNLSAIAKGLGKLALADQSIPRDKIKPINLASKPLADAALELHEAAEANKAADFAALFTTLRARAADLLTILGPDPYICEMHCEGPKTYDKPGTCPICTMDLTRVSQTPYSVDVSTPKGSSPLVAGKPAALDIRLFEPAGTPVGPIDVVHEHPLHLIIVSADLSFYAHEHPTRTPDGLFHLSAFTFPFGGRYTVYADFTPTSRANQVVQTDITIPPGDVPAHTPITLVEDEDGVGKDGDYEFRIRCNAQKFFGGGGQDSFLRYGVDLKGQPVTDLQPLMGALGHLVIISADRKTYIHAHPLDLAAKPGESAHDHEHAGHAGHNDAAILEKARAALLSNGKPSDIVFHAVFPTPGLYRAFAQFQHKGKILTYAATIDAKKPAGDASAPAPATPAHDHDKH